MTLLSIILSTMGWVRSMGWFFYIGSIAYRLLVIKLIFDFRQSIPKKNDITICSDVGENGGNVNDDEDPVSSRLPDNPNPPHLTIHEDGEEKRKTLFYKPYHGLSTTEVNSVLNQPLVLMPES
jgi:hypothetical protein